MDCFKRFAESVVPKWPKLVGSSIVFVQFFLLCLEDDEENGAPIRNPERSDGPLVPFGFAPPTKYGRHRLRTRRRRRRKWMSNRVKQFLIEKELNKRKD